MIKQHWPPILLALFLASLLVLWQLRASTQGDPLLAVVIMVKNEATGIEATLQTYVEGGIRDFLVFDTGSTDNTQGIVRAYFDKLRCQKRIDRGILLEEPFVNFAVSRNRALDLADKEFPHAIFYLMPDAEWYAHNVEGLLQFCQDHRDDARSSYLVRITSKNYILYKSVLIRRDTHERFMGVVHEWLNTQSQYRLPDDIHLEWRPSDAGTQKSLKRFERDRDLLLKEYEKNPQDPRTVFYLGQSYSCMQDWYPAYRYWTERTKIKGGNVEEDCATWYRLGVLTEKIGETDSNFTWDMALECLLRAHSMRPQRAEALIMIASHYVTTKEYPLAYLFAHRACEIPYPTTELISVEPQLYDYYRYDIIAKSAWYVRQYAEGRVATIEALKTFPDDEYLQKLLASYTLELSKT